MTPSIFDTAEFNSRLFYPRPCAAPPPPGATDCLVEVERGVHVHGRAHPAPEARAVLLYFHGNGEVVPDYDDAADAFVALGVRPVFFGYRGYARSTGVPTLRASLQDAHAILRQVRESGVGTPARPIIVMGRSLGSAPAIELAARAEGVAALIVESGWADPLGVLARRGIRPFVLSDEERQVFSNVEKMREVRVPVLIVHGALDDLIEPREAELNHAAVGAADKRLVILRGCGHNNISRHPKYFDTLGEFIGAPFRGGLSP